jgi:hypothetical protein
MWVVFQPLKVHRQVRATSFETISRRKSKDSFGERLQKLVGNGIGVRPDGGRAGEQIRVWLGIRLWTSED